MKAVSIEHEGLAEHINRYFKQRSKPYTYDDVIRLKNLRVAGRPVPLSQQAQELGISRPSLYKWQAIIDKHGL